MTFSGHPRPPKSSPCRFPSIYRANSSPTHIRELGGGSFVVKLVKRNAANARVSGRKAEGREGTRNRDSFDFGHASRLFVGRASGPCRTSSRQIGARIGGPRETGQDVSAARSSCARRGSGSLNIPLSCPSPGRECATFLFFSLFFRGICQGVPPIRRGDREPRGRRQRWHLNCKGTRTSRLTAANRTAAIGTGRSVGQMETF